MSIGPKSKRSWAPTRAQIRASEAARAEADREAARIPWPQLRKARREYIRWQACVLWLRSIEETDGALPPWLAERIERRARGFLRYAADYSLQHKHAPRPVVAWRLLEQWLNENIFHKPRAEGWMNAVGYYAIKDLGSLRDDAYSEWCINAWKEHPPAYYPSFTSWCRASERMTDEMLDRVAMRDDRRELIKHMRNVGPRALQIAVEKYVEWDVVALWARAGLQRRPKIPPVITRALYVRCPGFLDQHATDPHRSRIFDSLMQWIEDRYFPKAKREGWLDVLLYEANLHPRLARAKDYWINWEHEWARAGRHGYPSLKTWMTTLDCCTFRPEGSGSIPQNFACVE